jgi:hypothetical protein
VGYNAQAMFFHNSTQAFMKKYFVEPEDYKFIHAMARKSVGDNKKRKQEIVEHTEARVAEKRAKKLQREKKAKEKAKQIAEIALVLDKDKVTILKGQKLKDQLSAFKSANAPNLKGVTGSSKVGLICEKLCESVDLYQSGQWKLQNTIEIDESELVKNLIYH